MAANKKKDPEEYLMPGETVIWKEDREMEEAKLAGGILILILLLLFFPLGIIAAIVYWLARMSVQKAPRQTVFVTTSRVFVVEDGELQMSLGLVVIEAVAVKKRGVELIARTGETQHVPVKSSYAFVHNLRRAILETEGRQIPTYGNA